MEKKNQKLNTYLDQIGDKPLLTDEEERALAERIQQGDARAIERLVASNLKYVVRIAREYTGQGLSLDEIISEGNMGMLKAASKYGPNRGKRFVVYAAPFIREAIEAGIELQAGLYRIPKAEATPEERKRSRSLSVDEPIPQGSANNYNLLNIIENTDAPQADNAAEQAGLSEELLRVMDVLNERELCVVKGIYGIGTDHLTMAEIATEMGLKRERVRQIRDKALRKLNKTHRARLRELEQ